MYVYSGGMAISKRKIDSVLIVSRGQEVGLLPGCSEGLRLCLEETVLSPAVAFAVTGFLGAVPIPDA